MKEDNKEIDYRLPLYIPAPENFENEAQENTKKPERGSVEIDFNTVDDLLIKPTIS